MDLVNRTKAGCRSKNLVEVQSRLLTKTSFIEFTYSNSFRLQLIELEPKCEDKNWKDLCGHKPITICVVRLAVHLTINYWLRRRRQVSRELKSLLLHLQQALRGPRFDKTPGSAKTANLIIVSPSTGARSLKTRHRIIQSVFIGTH